MCLGIPGEVVEIHPEHPDLAKVNVSGVKRLINIGLLADDPPKPGEWVLIHVGFALSKIDEAVRVVLDLVRTAGNIRSATKG